MERRIYFSHHMYGKKMAFTQEVFYTNEVVPLCQRERFVEEVTSPHLTERTVNRNHECTENGKENAQKTVTTVHKNQ